MKRPILLAALLFSVATPALAQFQPMKMDLFDAPAAPARAAAPGAPGTSPATGPAGQPSPGAPAPLSQSPAAQADGAAVRALPVGTVAAVDTGKTATPSCPAGQPNPATAVAAAADLPYTLQKLYALRLPSFTDADLNCDGFLDSAEIQTLIEAKFKGADANKDGVIDANEAQAILATFADAAAANPGIIAGPREDALKHRLTIMDTNNDGVISHDEFVTYFQARYQKLDRNGDGRLDITEYQTDDEENRVQRDETTPGAPAPVVSTPHR